MGKQRVHIGFLRFRPRFDQFLASLDFDPPALEQFHLVGWRTTRLHLGAAHANLGINIAGSNLAPGLGAGIKRLQHLGGFRD